MGVRKTTGNQVKLVILWHCTLNTVNTQMNCWTAHDNERQGVKTSTALHVASINIPCITSIYWTCTCSDKPIGSENVYLWIQEGVDKGYNWPAKRGSKPSIAFSLSLSFFVCFSVWIQCTQRGLLWGNWRMSGNKEEKSECNRWRLVSWFHFMKYTQRCTCLLHTCWMIGLQNHLRKCLRKCTITNTR